jgi:hypothetical protein
MKAIVFLVAICHTCLAGVIMGVGGNCPFPYPMNGTSLVHMKREFFFFCVSRFACAGCYVFRFYLDRLFESDASLLDTNRQVRKHHTLGGRR